MSNTIRAELTGDASASAAEIVVRNPSPVLALCRRLVAAGHDPDSGLEAYRSETLCLTVRSIGVAARLRVGAQGRSFIREGKEAGGASSDFPDLPATPLAERSANHPIEAVSS